MTTSITPPSPAPVVTYAWDNNGNLTGRGSDSFAWDCEDRMTSATVNSATTTFAYRGDGLRNSRTTGGVTTTFTWDIAGGLPVVLDDGAKYVYGAGLVSQVSGANTCYYLADGLGSTMKTVDATGTVVNGYTYDIYGKKTSSTGSQVNEFDFAGQQTDPAGLQYLRARYYDPETGTFMSREPMAMAPSWGGNPFAYGAGNPARYSDPTGLFPIDESGCALNDPSCQGRAKAEADENSVCNGLYYYQWQFCRDTLDSDWFTAKVIHVYDTAIIVVVKQLLGEYGHRSLVQCVRDEQCRDIGDAVFGAWTTNSIALGALAKSANIPVALLSVLSGQSWNAYKREYGGE